MNNENIENILSDEKLYGSSILETDERLISEDNDDNIFDDIKNNYSDKDIEDMRNELKDANDNIRNKDKVYTDAISGIKSSKKIEDIDTNKSISNIIDSKEKNGKEISLPGIDLINNLLDANPTDEEIKSLSDYFNNIVHVDDIYSEDINVLKNILGKRISDKLIDIANKNSVSEYSAITRFMSQMYKSYIDIIQYNDDINELYDLVMNISEKTDDIDFNDKDSLMDQYKILSNATERLKNLNDRNKRLKNEYTVTDFDILAVDSVKKCLDDALSFKKIYDKIDNINPKKLKSDLRNNNEIKNHIGNWINDLRNDSDTLYTLPVNDYLSISKSVDEMINYIEGFILLQDNSNRDTITDIETAISEKNIYNSDGRVYDYLIDNGHITKNDLKNYENSAILLLYIMSKTFKKKKIKTNDDRRILSYTLDMISKISKMEYGIKFIELINYISGKFLNIKPYNHIVLIN